MACSCNLVGRTRKDTAINELKYTSSRSITILRTIMNMRNKLYGAKLLHDNEMQAAHVNSPYVHKELREHLIDVVNSCIKDSESFCYDCDGKPGEYLRHLLVCLENIKNHGENPDSIPFETVTYDRKSTVDSSLHLGLKTAMFNLVKDIEDVRAKLNAIVNMNFDKSLSSNVTVNISFKDGSGNEVSVPDLEFDIQSMMRNGKSNIVGDSPSLESGKKDEKN